MKYSALAFCFCLSALLVASSCKKGCLNKQAINYNSSAKVEDGSCWFCDSAVLDKYDTRTYAYDNQYPPDLFYDSIILYIKGKGNLYQYSGNHCAAIGYTSACDPGETIKNFAYINVTLQN